MLKMSSAVLPVGIICLLLSVRSQGLAVLTVVLLIQGHALTSTVKTGTASYQPATLAQTCGI